ncbi:MAG: zf-HC2 domain-containing protein [Candidatus Accumulibacter sp. UW26]|jgi:hypothetical protein
MKCEDAVRLMSAEMDRELCRGERFSLRLHQIVCLGCRRYRQHLSFLREACRRQASGNESAPPDR